MATSDRLVKKRLHRLDLIVCLGLVSLCLGFFWPVFRGRALVPTEGIYLVDHIFECHCPPSITEPLNTNLIADQIYQMYAWRLFTIQSLAAGRVPLWNPYAACGTPFLANHQSAVLNPVNFIANLLLPPALGQTVFILLTLISACLLTYGFVRSLGGSPLGSFVSGMTFGFEGFIFIWLGIPLSATATFLPAILWATHWLAQRPTAARATLLAVMIGWQFLAGHLSTSVQTLAFWLVFVGYEFVSQRLINNRRWCRRFAGFAALGLLLGIGLGMPQLLPLRESFGLSSMTETGRSRWLSKDPMANAKKAVLGDWWYLRHFILGEIALLFLPERHGNPAFGDYRFYPSYGNYAERSNYIGGLALLALAVGFLSRPPPGYHRFFLLAAIIIFGVLLHLPIFNIVTYLPVLRYASPSRMRFIFTLCAAVTVGMALTNWLDPKERTRREQPSPGVMSLLFAFGSGFIALLTLPFLVPTMAALERETLLLRLAKLFAPAAVFSALALVLWLRSRSQKGSSLFSAALVVIVVFDFFLFGAHWHVTSPAQPVLPQLAEIETVRRLVKGGRLSGPPNVFAPNIAMIYDLFDARVYDPLSVNRFTLLVESLTGIKPNRNTGVETPLKGQYEPCPSLERLTSTRVGWRWDAARGPWQEQVRDSLPRAYVVMNVQAVTASEVLTRLVNGANPFKLTFIESASAHSRSSEPIRPAKIIKYNPHHVLIRTSTNLPAWLVLTDTYYPGWRACVNGKPTPIAVANYAFRSVPIPAGEVTISYDYEPATYRLGLFLGLGAIMVITVILSASFYLRFGQA